MTLGVALALIYRATYDQCLNINSYIHFNNYILGVVLRGRGTRGSDITSLVKVHNLGPAHFYTYTQGPLGGHLIFDGLSGA